MTDRFYLTTNPDADAQYISFDVRDAKGRTIGCRVQRETGTFAAEPSREYHSFYSDRWVGPAFVACVEATRNDVRYGACQRDMIFRTEAEREAFIERRIASSLKAAAKKAA